MAGGCLPSLSLCPHVPRQGVVFLSDPVIYLSQDATKLHTLHSSPNTIYVFYLSIMDHPVLKTRQYIRYFAITIDFWRAYQKANY